MDLSRLAVQSCGYIHAQQLVAMYVYDVLLQAFPKSNLDVQEAEVSPLFFVQIGSLGPVYLVQG